MRGIQWQQPSSGLHLSRRAAANKSDADHVRPCIRPNVMHFMRFIVERPVACVTIQHTGSNGGEAAGVAAAESWWPVFRADIAISEHAKTLARTHTHGSEENEKSVELSLLDAVWWQNVISRHTQRRDWIFALEVRDFWMLKPALACQMRRERNYWEI